MKKVVKIGLLILGICCIGIMMSSGLEKGGGSKDAEAAKGRTPSPSYTYHLQIFHAF